MKKSDLFLAAMRKKIYGEEFFSPSQKEMFPGLRRELILESEDISKSDDPVEACMERQGYTPAKIREFQRAISEKLTPDMFGKTEKITGAEAMYQEKIEECIEKTKPKHKEKELSLFGRIGRQIELGKLECIDKYGAYHLGRYQRADSGYVRYDTYYPNDDPGYEGKQATHITGPNDRSCPYDGPTDSINCDWCYLNAVHSVDAHIKSIENGLKRQKADKEHNERKQAEFQNRLS